MVAYDVNKHNEKKKIMHKLDRDNIIHTLQSNITRIR